MASKPQDTVGRDLAEIGTAPDVAAAIQAWLSYLTTERDLAAHTVEAYTRDLAQFLRFLAQHLGGAPDMPALLSLSARDVRSFLAYRRSQDVGSRSLSRSLSALRMFFRFLERRGYGKNDAVRAVSMPKLPHAVPKPLPEQKAAALMEGADIAAPDAPEWALARDTAVLTLLYGSGLRISEALSLQVADAPIKGRDALRVTGKGNKARVVPVLPVARSAVQRYLDLCPKKLGPDDPLFIGVRGKQTQSTDYPAATGEGARRARPSRHGHAPCAAPFLRHPSAGGGCGFASDPGIARPCEPLDYARLYRGRPRPSPEGL